MNPDDLDSAAWTIAVGICATSPARSSGCYLVLRRMSLLGDAISHAVLPGIAVAFLLTRPARRLADFLGAMAVGVLTAFLTTRIHASATCRKTPAWGWCSRRCSPSA